MLQYDETDWEFFKRIISRLNGVLFPEICAQSPKIYVGLPNPGEKSIDITHDKTLSLDFTQSAWTKANEQRGTELDHIKQRIRSQSEYPLGTNLIYEGKPFTITEQTIHGDIQVQGGYLERTYTLQPRGGCYINHYYQENDTGLHLQGKVLEVDQDRFRVHLDIDEKQDPNTAYWFPIHSDYVANQHTGQYIMPEKGSVVYLYFPNRKEEEASIRAVRRIDGETNAKTQDPDTKYISNATGKHWKMDKRSLNIVIEEGHFFIEQDASKGIQIKSNQAIQITSEQDIQFQAPSVNLTAKEEISLEGKNRSLILDKETHFKSSKISGLGVPVPSSYQQAVIPKTSSRVSSQFTKKVQNKGNRNSGFSPPVRALYKEAVTPKTSPGVSAQSTGKVQKEQTTYPPIIHRIFNMVQDRRLTPEQIQLRDAVNQEAERLYTSKMSDREVGPAVAGVFDMKTGKYYFGKNNAGGRVPHTLHPLIRERIKNMPKEVLDRYAKFTLGAGSHAEVIALNEALLANPKAELKDFMVYVVRSGRKLQPKGLPMPRCPHCEYITNGVSYFPEGLHYGRS